MNKAIFELDCLNESFEGWHNPEVRWNGFACPFFTKDTTIRILTAMNADGGYRWVYDEDKDRFICNDMSAPEYENEIWKAEFFGEQMLFPVGAFSWTWLEKGFFDE